MNTFYVIIALNLAYESYFRYNIAIVLSFEKIYVRSK